MKILWMFLRKNKGLFFFTLFFLLMQTICILLIPFFTEEIVDHGIASGSINTVLSIAVKMMISSAIGFVVSITCTYLTAKLSSKLGADIREKLYTHIQGFTLEKQKQYGPAALATRGSGDVANVQQVIVMLIQMILPGPFIGIVAVIMTWGVSRELALVVALTILLFFGTVIFVFYKSLNNMKAIQERIDRMVAKLREVFVGVKIIRAFDNSDYEEERTNDTFVAHANNIIAINRRFAFISPTAFLFLGVVMAAILWFGSFEVTTGAVQIGAVTAVIEYVTLALLQLLSGALVTVMIPRAVASLTRVQNVLDQQTTLTDREQVKDAQYNANIEDLVQFDNVTFQYPGAEKAVLDGISFSVKRGQTVAVIGATASGKSTVAKILLRFDDIQSGSIRLGGVNIRKLSQKFLRDKISYVPQTAFLFSGTVRENLKYAGGDISDEQMVKAAQIAQADGFISALKEGYNSAVARGGTNFSGGQKQRLCIARALAKPADVYVFDDSFSALDNRTDAMVRKAIKENLHNVAVIIIAQKLSSILDADEIIVLDKGKIVGKGTHEELLETNAVYREFAVSQQLVEGRS